MDDTPQQWETATATRVPGFQTAGRHLEERERERYTYLVAGGAPGLDGFCVVPPAEQFAVLVKVDEIDQELFAYRAGEAARVPAVVGAQARGGHADISAIDRTRTLKGKNATDERGEMFDLAILEILTLSHLIGACSVTGICLTVPLPSASRFLCAANSLSSFFSSSLRLLQYLKQ